MVYPRGVAWGLLGAGLALTGGCIQREPVPPGGVRPTLTSTVRVALGQRHQTLEGFGASIAWYLREASSHERKDELFDVIFRDLGLDILRFRNRYGRSDPQDAMLQQEVEIYRGATQSLGRPPKLMLTSWSPPGPLKANGKEGCNGNASCTLAKENGEFVYAKFADYWLLSLTHYASLGLVPDFVSIQNEPSFIPPSWEGCKLEPTETADYPGYDRALRAVHAKLQRLSSPPRLVGPEVLGIHWDLPQEYFRALDSGLLYGFAHHLYEKGDDGVWDWREPGPDSFVDEMQRAGRVAPGLPIFQTEFNTDEDRGTDGGLETAWLIHHSLVEEKVNAWLYWDLVWGQRKGLVSINGSAFKARDQYHAVRHYARFTDPGYVRVGAAADSRDVRASAYIAPDQSRLSLIVLNVGKRDRAVVVDPGGFSHARSDVYRTVFRPGRSKTWVSLGRLPPDSSVVLPSRSMATVVFE